MVSLICYADRLAGNLKGLRRLLDTELAGLFGGIHILPFFDPIDGADAGFDPKNHLQVDARLGDWSDIATLAGDHSVMADMIVNHISADSPQFEDVVACGSSSEFWSLFLRRQDVFPGSADGASSDPEIARIYRPRPGQPFTSISLADGSVHDFWTSFSAGQLDINVESEAGWAYLESILKTFAAAGVREVRLDAAGYAIKRRGTSCFMLPETHDFIARLATSAGRRGISSLVEIHSHFETQIAIAAEVDRVYDFALPPLVLHALYTGCGAPLKRWLAMAPRNCVTVLDTHDGIGIVDVARHDERPGLLGDEEVSALVEAIHEKTGGQSRRASGHAASNLDVYQVNSTFYDALGREDVDYLIARAIQFFAPGTPQVYYVGLLAGENDLELVERTGVGRDINRHYYSAEEIGAALKQPVVQQLMALIRLRNSLPVFDGEFRIEATGEELLSLLWIKAADFARLTVNLDTHEALIEYRRNGVEDRFPIDSETLALVEVPA